MVSQLVNIILKPGKLNVFNLQVIAITVEDEEDVAKFKDYKPSKSDDAAAPKQASVSTPPKEDVVEKPINSPEPKVLKSSTPQQTGDRIFASPLAKKLAEDNNVYYISLYNQNLQQQKFLSIY